MSGNQFIKDPEAKLDYVVDWSAWLEPDADTIATSEWDAPDGLTVESEAATNSRATVWLSGGTEGSVYPVVNSIVTAAGRTDERTIYIHVNDK